VRSVLFVSGIVSVMLVVRAEGFVGRLRVMEDGVCAGDNPGDTVAASRRENEYSATCVWISRSKRMSAK
jgi:hypothetical protein